MKNEDRLKAYREMTEVSRKWVSVMDAKAAFLSALNAGLLTFIWSGARLVEKGGGTKWLALVASGISIVSLLAALWVVLPRESLSRIFGKGSRYADGFKAVSFYGYVATHYPKGKEGEFISDVEKMDVKTLAFEALEQHFTISHTVQQKSVWVTRAGWLLFTALIFAGLALVAEVVC